MPLDDATRSRIDSLVTGSPVLLFMKGTRSSPQCGFSATVVGILDGLLSDYATCDVLADPEIRQGIKDYSSWPTIPQLYVRGEFIGGCDIVRELFASGELAEKLGVEPPRAPTLRVSERAAEALRRILAARAGDGLLHLRVDAGFDHQLYLGPAEPGELEVESNGIRIAVDAATARRAEGLAIDAEETDDGPAFRIENPSASRA
jgi:monothiol glutaredoxin